MRKKSIISTILFLVIAFIGCQKNNIQQSKNYENKSDVKIVKREKLKKCTKTEFYDGIGKEDWRELSIIQITDKEITATISHYFLILGLQNGNYKIQKIVDLLPYKMNYYYSEESTEFYPSKNGEKYLIYNEYYTNKKNEGVHAKDNKNLKSILIDFNKDQVKYLKGNQFEKIKEENGISQKYLAKTVKTPKKLKKYADKKGYVIGESVKYKKRTLCIMKKANEESLLKSKIYELNNGKIKRIFQFN